MKYTEEQQDAINKCINFIDDKLDEREHFTMTGSPGTGKTVSIRGVLEHYRGGNVAAAAPSHIATNVLANSLSGLRVSVMTIAKLLGSTPNMNKSKDDIRFTMNPMLSQIERFDIIVIDEASMIDSFTYDAILAYKKSDTKIIFIGDKNQLPPVNERGANSPTLDEIDVELTKIMRFEGPIAEVVNEAKDQLELLHKDEAADTHFINSKFGRNGRKSRMEGTTGYIFLKKPNIMLDLFIKEYNIDPDNMDNTRILLFRNDYVIMTNNAIRERLYGDNPLQFELGELICSNGGYRNGKNPVIHNRETYKVRGYETGFSISGVPCINLILEPRPHYPSNVLTPSIAENGLKIYQEKLDAITFRCQQTKQWTDYHAFKGQFSWWDYTYAQNLYLAQGKTYNSVFVVESEIQGVKPLQVKQRLQALYVGLSRAKERLYIYNKKYSADGSTYINKKDFKKLFDS